MIFTIADFKYMIEILSSHTDLRFFPIPKPIENSITKMATKELACLKGTLTKCIQHVII